MENHALEIKNMSKSKALAKGAVAMFGEKYDDEVRVVNVQEFQWNFVVARMLKLHPN